MTCGVGGRADRIFLYYPVKRKESHVEEGGPGPAVMKNQGPQKVMPSLFEDSRKSSHNETSPVMSNGFSASGCSCKGSSTIS